MISKTTVVCNPTGIHARPASDFVKRAKDFSARIKVRNLDNTQESGFVSAKSIISVLSLEMCLGNKIEISADGEDEQAAVEAMVQIVESGFGEC